jgi:hypothetical protein
VRTLTAAAERRRQTAMTRIGRAATPAERLAAAFDYARSNLRALEGRDPAAAANAAADLARELVSAADRLAPRTTRGRR